MLLRLGAPSLLEVASYEHHIIQPAKSTLGTTTQDQQPNVAQTNGYQKWHDYIQPSEHDRPLSLSQLTDAHLSYALRSMVSELRLDMRCGN